MENEIVIEITPEKIKKIAPLLAILIIALISTGVIASYILHFLYERPAGITVTSNFYEVAIYSDVDLTDEVTSILFPSIMFQDEAGMDSTTQTLYLHGVDIQGGKPVYCSWTSDVGSLYPGVLSVSAEYFDGSDWLLWVEDVDTITLTDTDPTMMIRFTCDGGSAYVNSFEFTIEVKALSDG